MVVMVPYNGKFLRGKILVNFMVCVKFIHKNQKIYMVHALFLIDSQIFCPTKISPLYGIGDGNLENTYSVRTFLLPHTKWCVDSLC